MCRKWTKSWQNHVRVLNIQFAFYVKFVRNLSYLRKKALFGAVFVAFWLVANPPLHAQTLLDGSSDVASAISLRLDMRLRYTNIEQSNKPQRVDVTTVRMVPGIEVRIAPQLTLTVDLIHTDFIGPKRYNDDPAAFASPYPLLPDPHYTGLNQATLQWTVSPQTHIIAGRQAVKIGNERHVSDDNFRQVPQLFDGVLANLAPFDGGQLTLGHFPRMRSKFGSLDRANLSVLELAFNPANDVSGSFYALRAHPPAAASNAFLYGVTDTSNLTYGATSDASMVVGPVRASVNAELARQRATSSGSPLIAATYYRVGAGATLKGWTVRADHENRGSNHGKYGFQTVLSDYYAFNGNALIFFATPKDGLRDTWATLRWEQGPWTMLHEYHWFKADASDKDYGRELDLNFTYKIDKHWYSRAQWAHYRPDARPAPDVDKVWITLGYLMR
jgi:hypothetical protein